MGLTVTVLGCSGSYPGPASACSGYLVRGAGTALWLDAGSGTLANLQRHIAIGELDGIVLSHEHPDHWSDLEGYRVACAYVLERPTAPVYAPAGLRRRVYGEFAPLGTWHAVGDGDRATIGGLDVRFSRTDHPPETLAVRITGEGRTMVYSADTGPGWDMAVLGQGADLALCEATYLQDREGTAGHLSARQAGAMARRAGAAQLVLTHLWPTVDEDHSRAEAEAAYGAPVTMARLHHQYEV